MYFSSLATVAFAAVASCLPTAEVEAPFSHDLEVRAPSDYSYKTTVLWHHNAHRQNHSAPALTWNQDLANIAQQTALTCDYKHNVTAGGGGYGQNIAAGVPYTNISYIITNMFYNAETNYYTQYGQEVTNFNTFENWGHFTQIVWKGTTSVGCATVGCVNGLQGVGSDVPPWFTVCNYGPPGNYANNGQFAANVLPPLNEPSIYWYSGQ